MSALGTPESRPETFVKPGHVFPLRASEGGTLKRAGHTEAAVDLARLAGCHPAGILSELQNDDGTMMRGPELLDFADEHGLKAITIADLIVYRRMREVLVELDATRTAAEDALMAELLTRLLRGRTDREEEVDTEGLGGATGVKGIEKMEALRKRFANYPGERTRHVKDKVEQMLRDQNSRGLEAFVQSHSQIHRDKVSLCMAALFCDIIRAADDKDYARVSDIACGGILCLDQFHISGNLDLAWNLTLMPDPASLRVHKDKPTVAAVAKSKAHGRHRFSALAEPKVVAAALNEWKNYESMAKLENDA